MNILTNTPKKKTNDKVLYKGVAIAIAIVTIGGFIDAMIFDGVTIQTAIAVSIIAGFILGISWVSAITGMKIKELVL